MRFFHLSFSSSLKAHDPDRPFLPSSDRHASCLSSWRALCSCQAVACTFAVSASIQAWPRAACQDGSVKFPVSRLAQVSDRPCCSQPAYGWQVISS